MVSPPKNQTHLISSIANHSLKFLLLTALAMGSGCQWAAGFGQGDKSVELFLEPAGEQEAVNLANMLAADPPTADLADIYGRHNGGQTPARTVDAPNWQVGDTDQFFYTEQANDTVIETTARVIYRSPELIMWLEENADVADSDLQLAAEVLENEILPTTRTLFGSEPNPGIDNDPAIHILHIADMGGNTIGYFSGKDEYTQTIAPFSNEREMFYINLDFVTIGGQDYFDVVSHEFQHMIHWNLDRNEQTWINEGLAELSTTENGYGGSDFLPEFLSDTDTSLTAFDYEGGDYGAAWLLMGWLHEKFGETFIQDLVRQPKNGIEGLEALLVAQTQQTTFEEIYADWTVAYFALDQSLDLGIVDRYAFAFAAPYIRGRPKITPTPIEIGEISKTTVGQFGTDFWELPSDKAVSLTILPSQQVRLIDADPVSGDWYWTTVPADFSDMHLTHQVDLSAVTTATLNYQTWFDIELIYDYAYVAVSADNGRSWETLLTTASVDANPQGKNLGNGITGTSGGQETPIWVQHSADLSPYAGTSDLLIRFQYITDDAVQNQGFALDDISIPEIGWFDDVESSENDWTSAGFVRHTNRLPQTFIVQTIAINNDQSATVTAHTVNADFEYKIDIPIQDNLNQTILVISGSTPVTYQAAGYQLSAEDIK